MSKKTSPLFILELSYKCNQDCPYCYNVWKNNTEYRCEDLPFKDYLKIVGKIIKEKKPKLITLSGGEPLLNKNIFEIVGYIKSRGIKINLITNGTLLSDDIIKKLIKSGVSLFELTLLSSDPETHDKITGLKNSWEKTIASMASIKKHKGKLAVVLVITSQNINNAGKTLKLAIAMGADGILLNRANLGGKCVNNFAIMPDVKKLEKTLDIADKLAQDYEVPISVGVPIQPCIIDTDKYENIRFGYCQTGKEYPYYAVDPMGNVRPCNHSDIILGNLSNQSVNEILNSSLLKDFERAFPKICEGCSKLPECQGGCKAAAQACFNDIKEADPFLKQNWQGNYDQKAKIS